MSKTIVTIYKCDICGKEYQSDEYPDELESVLLPARLHDEHGSSVVEEIFVDLCRDCHERLHQTIINHFAEIWSNPSGAVHAIRKDTHLEIPHPSPAGKTLLEPIISTGGIALPYYPEATLTCHPKK